MIQINFHRRYLCFFTRIFLGTWTVFLGFCSPTQWLNFHKNNGILHGGKVYDTEIMGATMALLAAIQARQGGEKIFILLDYQVTVRTLQSGKTSSCIKLTREFHDVLRKKNVEIKWVQDHSKIWGNEEVTLQRV